MQAAADLLVRYKLDVDAYHRMGEAGILGEDDRVELIDGELIAMSPIGQGHESVVNRLNEALVLAFAGRAIVSVQNSVRLDRLNEPQPDFAVFRRRADFYGTGERPKPSDVLLLIEVADTSLRFDRAVKLPLYARAGIAELWILDLRGRVLEAHRGPEAGSYAETRAYRPGETISLALAPEIALPVSGIFG